VGTYIEDTWRLFKYGVGLFGKTKAETGIKVVSFRGGVGFRESWLVKVKKKV